MRALIQRVAHASVSVDAETVGAIGLGLVVFLGVRSGDTEADAVYIMEKVANLRIMADADGRFNLSVLDAGGQVLLISQFTLYAGTRRGRRPSFTDSAPAEVAELLFERSAALLKEQGLNVETGRFRQHMMVELVNDGPVTIMLDSADREQPRRG